MLPSMLDFVIPFVLCACRCVFLFISMHDCCCYLLFLQPWFAPLAADRLPILPKKTVCEVCLLISLLLSLKVRFHMDQFLTIWFLSFMRSVGRFFNFGSVRPWSHTNLPKSAPHAATLVCVLSFFVYRARLGSCAPCASFSTLLRICVSNLSCVVHVLLGHCRTVYFMHFFFACSGC